jgi:hypothetical protein
MSEIVKICKKHGELTIDNTYLQFTKNKNKQCRMCLICKKGYRNNWSKLNPDKLIRAQAIKKTKRLKEAEDGILSYLCKTHGQIPIDRIRIDARGTKICRICSNLQKQNQRDRDPEGYKKKYHEWLYSDRTRVQRYRKQDQPNRQKRQVKSYHRMKIVDPVNFKRKERLKLDNAIKYRKNLTDSYVKSQLKDFRVQHNKVLYRKSLNIEIPKELIEAKKELMRFKRKLKTLKNQEK